MVNPFHRKRPNFTGGKFISMMKERKFGKLTVPPIGFGAMGLSMGYGQAPTRSNAIKMLKEAYDTGYRHFDTAEIYANGQNEEMIGEALRSNRKEIILATKFLIQEPWENKSKANLEKELRTRLENSLSRLQTEYLDIYYQHRVNKDIPVERVAEIMGKFIDEGKIMGWGQSQPQPHEIIKPHRITPLTCIQSEYSMMARQFEKEIIPLCNELKIGFVAFSPLAGGFLSGKITSKSTFEGFDARRVINRYEEKNMLANEPLLDLLNSFASKKAATPAQISLAWMLHKNQNMVAIPGAKKLNMIKENFAGSEISFTDEEFKLLDDEISKIPIFGNRRDEDIAKLRDLISMDSRS